MKDRFESLESGEVVSVRDEQLVLLGHRTFRVGELSDAIEAQLESAIAGWTKEKNGWLSESGIDCEALRFGSPGWQKGRIRLCLEFCPDEPTSSTQAANSSTPISTNAGSEAIGQAIPTPMTVPLPSTNTVDLHTEPSHSQVDRQDEMSSVTNIGNGTAPEITRESESFGLGIPVAAAAATIGIGAAATAAIATPEHQQLPEIDNPPLVDTILELEEHHSNPSVSHGGSLEEISIDFDSDNRDRGISNLNGRMELDLNDLSGDLSEQDFFGLEINGMSDPSDFSSFDNDRPENSGMLIDEVWNEMNQGNWPSIN